MLLGMIGFFYFYADIGLTGMFVVLFLMGTQSAFFGPSKYGILPEMLRPDDSAPRKRHLPDARRSWRSSLAWRRQAG